MAAAVRESKVRLICLGLGSVASAHASSNSLVQLAYFIVLGRLIHGIEDSTTLEASLMARSVEPIEGGRDSWSCAHDPAFSKADVMLLASLGIQASNEATCSMCGFTEDNLHSQTVYYMPHCPWMLYSAVLCRYAWRCASTADASAPLWAMCIIGNSFKTYEAALESSTLTHFPRAQLRAHLEESAAGLETRPVLAEDAVAAAVRMSCSGCETEIEDGCKCSWKLEETPFDAALAGRNGHVSFVQALSSTSLHHFFIDSK